jgi:hypothetical protein
MDLTSENDNRHILPTIGKDSSLFRGAILTPLTGMACHDVLLSRTYQSDRMIRALWIVLFLRNVSLAPSTDGTLLGVIWDFLFECPNTIL